MSHFDKQVFLTNTKEGDEFSFSASETGEYHTDGTVSFNDNGLADYLFLSLKDFASYRFNDDSSVAYLRSEYVGDMDSEGNVAWANEEHSYLDLEPIDGSGLYLKYSLHADISDKALKRINRLLKKHHSQWNPPTIEEILSDESPVVTKSVLNLKEWVAKHQDLSESLFPAHVVVDLNDGFTITDVDDGFQRVKVSGSNYTFKSELHGDTIEHSFDFDEVDQASAIEGFYDSLEEVKETYQDDAPLIIAECYYEKSIHV